MSASSLSKFSQILRPYQSACVHDAVAFALQCRTERRSGRDARRLYSAPTGSGKGSLELALLQTLRDNHGLNTWLLSPSLEVLRGVVERCGGDPSGLNEDALTREAACCYASTPTRARNRINSGDMQPPDVVLFDEAHHAQETSIVADELFAMAPRAVFLGFTATPYRGTPRGTKLLREEWGEPWVLLTFPEAAALGFIQTPICEVVPLVDDDRITVKNGEFDARSVGQATGDRMDGLALLISQRTGHGRPPTAVALPSTGTLRALAHRLRLIGHPCVEVTQATSSVDRARAYDACRHNGTPLLQIKVLAEGVDLPWLRRLIDARPTLSPVAWQQMVGRITRPNEVLPSYICTNRNLERHGYTLQGALPRSMIAAAQQAFEKPSTRSAGYRSLGLEKLGRFKGLELPLKDGVRTFMYNLSQPKPDGGRTEWCVLLDPCSPDTIVASRDVLNRDGEETTWGKWAQVDGLPDDLVGFGTSAARGELSVKQAAWWQRSAARYGLDPNAKITRRQFAALPMLTELQLTLLGE